MVFNHRGRNICNRPSVILVLIIKWPFIWIMIIIILHFGRGTFIVGLRVQVFELSVALVRCLNLVLIGWILHRLNGIIIELVYVSLWLSISQYFVNLWSSLFSRRFSQVDWGLGAWSRAVVRSGTRSLRLWSPVSYVVFYMWCLLLRRSHVSLRLGII